MTPDTQQQQSESYSLKIETAGQSATVPIAFLTPRQLEAFLQTEFKRLVQEAGVQGGARIHVERAMVADYQHVIREVQACLRSAKASAA